MPLVDPVELTQALVRCPTVTPDAGPALDLVQARLEGLGFSCHRLPFGGDAPDRADNLYARIGGDGPCLLFAGHVDVVPPGDPMRWSGDPFAGTIDDGFLRGRGASDMKSGVAASVAASSRHLAAGPPAGSIAFLITGDEEGPAVNGTVRVLEWMEASGERFDACVLPEPTAGTRTGDLIKIGRRGSLTARLVVRGRQGHTAYPHRADNAAHRIIAALHALTTEPLDDGTAHFEPSTLQVATVDVGNPAGNVVPGEARAVLNIRFSDRHDPTSLEVWLRQRIAPACPEHTLEIACNALPFLTQPGPFIDLVRDAIAEVIGLPPQTGTGGGTSDARFISRYGPVAELGLVGATMHQVDERVAVADILTLTAMLEAVLRRFLPRP